jgi:hypothetical protein
MPALTRKCSTLLKGAREAESLTPEVDAVVEVVDLPGATCVDGGTFQVDDLVEREDGFPGHAAPTS